MNLANTLYNASAADGSERGAYLFSNPDGSIRVGEIKTGDPSSGEVDLGPAPKDAIGEIHTHPDVTYPSGFVLPGGPPSPNDGARVASFHHYSIVVGKDNIYVIPFDNPKKAITFPRSVPQQ